MRYITLSLLTLSLIGACAEAPQAKADTRTEAKTVSHALGLHNGSERLVQTVKPGPNVRVSTELREPVTPGGVGTLNVTLEENYGGGILNVSAKTSDGMSLIGTNDKTSFNMASGNAHEWTVSFDAPEAGLHYVNFHVQIETPFGNLSRKSAAVIQVGKGLDVATASKSVGPVETNAEGKPVIIMQAQETITQEE